MKKVMSLFFVLMIVSTLITITGCGKSKEEEVNKTEFQVGNEKIVLENVSVLSDEVDILIPKSFNIMSEELAKTKYPYENRPTIIYTNESGSINIAFNNTENEAANSQIQEYTDSLIKSFENLYPSAEWYDSGVKELNDKTIGYIEVLTPAIDTEIYNLMCFTEFDGKLLIVTFNCIKDEMNDWEPIAKSIMDSLQFK